MQNRNITAIVAYAYSQGYQSGLFPLTVTQFLSNQNETRPYSAYFLRNPMPLMPES